MTKRREKKEKKLSKTKVTPDSNESESTAANLQVPCDCNNKSKDDLEKAFRAQYTHAWRGTFEFETNKEGHHWKYAKRQSWEVQRCGQKEFVKMHDIARGLDDENKKIVQRAIEASRPNISLNENEQRFGDDIWAMFDWLKSLDDKTKCVVPKALTLALNTVIKDKTLKSLKLVSTFVDDNLVVEFRGLKSRTPSWFYMRGRGASAIEGIPEFMLVTPSTFSEYHSSNSDEDITKLLTKIKCEKCLAQICSLFKHLRIVHKYTILSIKRKKTKILVKIQDDVSLSIYDKGRVCGCIPVPGKMPKEKRVEPAGVNSPEVVVTSPVVANALEDLSRIWQDPFAKSVLISAPPGSGKDAFALSIPFGNGRPTDNLQTLSMASEDQRSLERQLFGEQRTDGSIEKGLIAKAKDSALFLDEVHQPEGGGSGARASLLRPLESDEFFPLKSNEKQEVDDVLFIMATSKKLQELGTVKPPDFWTRMTHAVSIKHPLDFVSVQDGASLTEVTARFFCCFWWGLIEKHYKTPPIFIDPELGIADDQSKLINHWQVDSLSKCLLFNEPGSLWKKGVPLIFGDIFITELNNSDTPPSGFSVRGIRNMVTRLFSIALSSVTGGQDVWNAEQESFEKDVVDVFNEILNVAKLD